MFTLHTTYNNRMQCHVCSQEFEPYYTLQQSCFSCAEPVLMVIVERGIVMKQLAEELGCARSYLSQIVNGTRIGKRVRGEIAALLDLSVDQLFRDERHNVALEKNSQRKARNWTRILSIEFVDEVERDKWRRRCERSSCYFCGQRGSKGKPLDLDHDRETKRPRGTLCHKCNFMVWHVQEALASGRIEEVKTYLRNTKTVVI